MEKIDQYPLVSIIIPTYNREHLLSRAINSALSQTYRNFEIIIVDDGSTDNTGTLIAQHKDRYPIGSLHYLYQHNAGVSKARNEGIKHANGSLITFLDSDDEFLPQALEHFVRGLEDASADFVYSPAIEVYADGSEDINYPVAANHPELLAVEFFKNSNVRVGALMVKKTIFDRFMFDESLRVNDDYDFLQKVAVCFKAVYSDYSAVKIHHHEGNLSKDRVATYRSFLKSMENIFSMFPHFKEKLGKTASRRVVDIKLDLLEAMLLDGHYAGEAKELQRTLQNNFGTILRLYHFYFRRFINRVRRGIQRHYAILREHLNIL